jgi:His/Glu/Gln/Arg/opine family amino acid ABC transporter permease subunit
LHYKFNWQVLWRYREFLWSGFLVTIELSLIALIAAVVVGTTFGTIGNSKNRFLRVLALTYVEICRNIPLLVHILFWYVGLSALRIPNFWCGVIGLSLHSGAYIAEIVRSGIQSVPSGQEEAALSTGLTEFQAMLYIIYPQAFRIIIPSISGMFSQLIKDSSLASVVAVSELTFQAGRIEGETFRSFEAYLGISIMYFVFITLINSCLRISFSNHNKYKPGVFTK